MTDHVLGHVDGDELLAVVDGQGVAHEFRGDRRAPRPRLEDLLLARAVHLFDATEQCLVDVRALLERASHPRLLFLPSRHDPRVRRPRAPSGLVALGRLAPRSHGVIPLPLALAAAHGMVDWVHDRAAHCRPEATPTHAASLADRDVLVVEVAHLTDRGHAVETDEADLTGRQLQRRAVAFLGQELSLSTGASAELGTTSRLELDVVHERADRNVPRSEEHTSELQSLTNLVCRLLLDPHHLHLHSFPTRRSSDL